MQWLKNNILMSAIISLFKDIKGLIFKGERRLGFELAFGVSSVILLMVLFFGAYLSAAMNTINTNASIQNDNLKASIAATIISSIQQDVKNENYTQVYKKIQPMLVNKILDYVVVTDKSKNKILYSSLPKGSIYIKNGKLARKDKKNNALKNSEYIESARGDNYIYVGFFTNTIFKTTFDKIINQTPMLVLLSVFAGLLLAFVLARKIINPLTALIKATGEFQQGDLSNRVDKTSYLEINELVISYNSMADALQRLYSSLEHKVQDRTKKLESAYSELQSTQAMMVHSEKMKSLGELVAGIMHEINNPINFIYGNLIHLTNYSKDLIQIIDTYAEHEGELKPESAKAIKELKEEIDYEFLKSDLPDLIRSCKEGTERTRNIILDLKNFSRMEELALSDIDLSKEIDTTLNILHNKLKNRIEVHKDYTDNMPKVEAYGGQLNQVFMNILDNAAYAIKENGDVWIRINSIDNNVIIEIEDNGKGMDSETSKKIFDPFFTTKPVGQGTGLGMSISYKVIKNHHGTIKVDSELEKGTKFTITLPINQPKETPLIAEENSDDNSSDSEFETIE